MQGASSGATGGCENGFRLHFDHQVLHQLVGVVEQNLLIGLG